MNWRHWVEPWNRWKAHYFPDGTVIAQRVRTKCVQGKVGIESEYRTLEDPNYVQLSPRFAK